MDPRKFLELAEQLTQRSDPAELRTATGRAYYAVFNVAVEILDQIIPLSKGAAAHGQVQRILTNCGDIDLITAGRKLGNLHSRRIDADYEMGNTTAESPKTVRASVNEASVLIDALDHGFNGDQSILLKKTIQQYWTQTLREPLKGRAAIP